MCRVVAYLGRPIPLAHILYETDSSLVTQTYRPQMLANLNLAGFGMAVWNATSLRPDEPLVYRTTTLPAFDTNLRNLSSKVEGTCLLAHVRGVTLVRADDVSQQNVHPFVFPGFNVAVAHNGHLREFSKMRALGLAFWKASSWVWSSVTTLRVSVERFFSRSVCFRF